jgi:hypothetical protein
MGNSEASSNVRPGPLPFKLVADLISENLELSPAQHKRIALLNLAYIKSVAELDIKYIENFTEIIDDLGRKG